MLGLSPEYWNALASQIILISSLLGGFSFNFLTNINQIESSPRLKKLLYRGIILSVLGFIVTIFGSFNVFIMTTESYPFSISEREFLIARIVTSCCFLVGLASILFVIAVLGWIKENQSKWFTILATLIAIILIFLML